MFRTEAIHTKFGKYNLFTNETYSTKWSREMVFILLMAGAISDFFVVMINTLIIQRIYKLFYIHIVNVQWRS